MHFTNSDDAMELQEIAWHFVVDILLRMTTAFGMDACEVNLNALCLRLFNDGLYCDVMFLLSSVVNFTKIKTDYGKMAPMFFGAQALIH